MDCCWYGAHDFNLRSPLYNALVAQSTYLLFTLPPHATKCCPLLQAHEVDLLRSLGDMVMMELELRRRTSLQQTLCSLPSSLRVCKALQRLSHELRTPLHCISGSMELVLGMGDLSTSARECAQVCGGKGEGDLLGVLGVCCSFVGFFFKAVHRRLSKEKWYPLLFT